MPGRLDKRPVLLYEPQKTQLNILFIGTYDQKPAIHRHLVPLRRMHFAGPWKTANIVSQSAAMVLPPMSNNHI